MSDAKIVFQISLMLVSVEMLRVPYNSLIIAHEKMSFYAYNAMLEAMLKLGVVIALSIVSEDKVLVYAWLLLGVAVIVNVSYAVYCRLKISGVYFSVCCRWERVRSIGKFAILNVLTSLSDMGYQQGSSMILNVFYGVALNSTMGIANQVKTAVCSFTRSVQTAANPQIIKAWASGDFEGFMSLFMRISRMSFFMVLFLGMPLLINTKCLLSWWLTVIPPECVIFVRLMVVFCIFDSLTGPLWVTMQAAGRIASYQIVISVVWLLCLPLTYLAFRYSLPAYWLMIVLCSINVSLLVVRVFYTWHYCGVRVKAYLKSVVIPVFMVALIALCLPLLVACIIECPTTRLFFTTVLWCGSFPVAVYKCGMTNEERRMAVDMIRRLLHYVRPEIQNR